MMDTFYNTLVVGVFVATLLAAGSALLHPSAPAGHQPAVQNVGVSALRPGTVTIGSTSTEIEVPPGFRFAILSVGATPRAVEVPMSWTVPHGVEASVASSANGPRRLFGIADSGMVIFGPSTVAFGALAEAGEGATAIVSYDIQPER